MFAKTLPHAEPDGPDVRIQNRAFKLDTRFRRTPMTRSHLDLTPKGLLAGVTKVIQALSPHP